MKVIAASGTMPAAPAPANYLVIAMSRKDVAEMMRSSAHVLRFNTGEGKVLSIVLTFAETNDQMQRMLKTIGSFTDQRTVYVKDAE